MRKVISVSNYIPSDGEVNSGELITVPDLSYSLRELLDRYTSVGEAPPNIPLSAYQENGDDFEIDPTSDGAFDLVDADEIMSEISANSERYANLKKNYERLKARHHDEPDEQKKEQNKEQNKVDVPTNGAAKD